MEIVIRRGTLASASSDAVVLLRHQDEKVIDATWRDVDRTSGGLVAAVLKSGDFSGRLHEIAIVHPAKRRPRRVLLVGLGPRAELTRLRLLQAVALATRRARDLGARRIACALPAAPGTSEEPFAQAIAEGAGLGVHRFARARTEPDPEKTLRFELLVPDAASVKRLYARVVRGARWAESVRLARDLANLPGNDLTPRRLGERALEIGRASGARVQVLGVREMERLGMGAVLAVGKGSSNPPRFIVLERDSARPRAGTRGAARTAAATPTVVLVGKGITFDTGGISIKPREGMARMKYDMSGAAAVLGVFAALPVLDPPFRVVGLVPSAENMPDGTAFKPGDVVRIMDGTTVEITNTDAEGRLVLADALCYARRYQPAAVVDLATLTGAISLALGHLAAGLFTHDESLAQELERAAQASGERLWRLPLWAEYRDSLKTDVADLTNSGAREGGASIAAAFLDRFTQGMRWAHLDIASTAWAYADRPHEGRGPTGYGTRLLLEWLASLGTPTSATSETGLPQKAAPRRAAARRRG